MSNHGCVCEEPHHEREEFIGCDGCDKWYHFSCVNLSTEIVDAMGVNEKYYCPFCASKRDIKQATNPNNINNDNIEKQKNEKQEKMEEKHGGGVENSKLNNNNHSNNTNNNNDINNDDDKEMEDVNTFEDSQPTLDFLFKKPKAMKNDNEKREIKDTKKSTIDIMNDRIKKEEKNQSSGKKKTRNINKTSCGSNKQTKEEEKEENKIIYKVENTHEHPNSIFRKDDEYIYKVFNFTKEVEEVKKNNYNNNDEEEDIGETYVFTEDNIRYLIPHGFMGDIESIEMYNAHRIFCERLKEVLEYSCLIELEIRSQNPELQKKDQELINNCFKNTWMCPINSTPIRCDVTKFDFDKLISYQLKYNNNKLFDIIMMDPPWQLASSNPTRGVALGYNQLQDAFITQIPIEKLQTDGFIFIWIINGKYKFATELLKHWGYQLIGDIAWIKSTVNFRISRGHGFYLQHGKETCFVGKKGNPDMKRFRKNVCSDAIFSLRRGQSQKPTEIYEFIEHFAPPELGHTYIEIFGRRNNLRNGWVTLGNEL